MEKLTLAVPVLFGLERLAANELKRLNIAEVRAENGRVFCTASPADIARLNVNLRTGERVLIVMGRFAARSFEELFEGARALPWEAFIGKEDQFPVRGHCLDSQLHSVPSCQSILKKAVAARLGAHYGLETLPETGARCQIQFLIQRDETLLCLDTTGTGLHKRGYRARGVAASLRETLAAALVLLSRYRGRDPFCDPFCGAGTIPIEAALIAKNRAPGLDRSFDAQKWGWLDKSCWLDAADEAMDREYDGVYDIRGSDIDPSAVALAQENAFKAGVEDLVTFETADAGQFYRSEPRGRIVANPPYGDRLLDKDAAAALYRAFGRAVRKLPDGWQVFLLSAHTEFERAFGRPADKKRKLYNGMIKCDLFQYL